MSFALGFYISFAMKTTGRAASWGGSNYQLVLHSADLWKSGRLTYTPSWDDPADEEAIARMTPSLKKLAEAAPRMNVKYSQFVRAVLEHIQDGTLKKALDWDAAAIAARRACLLDEWGAEN